MPEIPYPPLQTCIAPLLPALGPATVSATPPPSVLPLLSPILRQRVQLLSEGTSDPWIRLLCRDAARAPRLAEVAAGPALEPHPSSGEIEVDWDGGGAEVRVKRVDEETLEAFVMLGELGIAFRLVYCEDESETGWRVGEVIAAEDAEFGGSLSVAEAEKEFADRAAAKVVVTSSSGAVGGGDGQADEEEDDDDYWDRYDATPGGRTPAAPRSPAPGASSATTNPSTKAAEDAYYAQYDSVQPALDPHDPDEAPDSSSEPAIDFVRQREENGVRSSIHGADAKLRLGMGAIAEEDDDVGTNDPSLHHPRPGSSSGGSNGSAMVGRLEELAEHQGRSEVGIRNHIAASVHSLRELARAAGIDGEEFRRVVLEGLDGE